MRKQVIKSVDLVYLLQTETELSNPHDGSKEKQPKYLSGQITIPVTDEQLPCNPLVVFTETVPKRKRKHYERLVETQHFSLSRRDDQRFYIAQRKGIDADEIATTTDWKFRILMEMEQVLEAISKVSVSEKPSVHQSSI